MNVAERDICFAQTHGLDLLGRIYEPSERNGHGIVMVHGGAWTANDRLTPHVMSRLLAQRGLVVFSLDFRCGPAFQHPAASADIAAGIRFFRSHAAECGINGSTIGLIGSSSGGHLVLYTALQPNIPTHQITTEIGSDDASGDASVAYVVALWPVSNPLARYEYALEQERQELVRAHQGYFGSRTAMHDASIQRCLRSREFTHLPPVFIVQPGEDANVPQYMTNDLLAAFQSVQHEPEYKLMEGLPHAFAYEASAATNECEAAVWSFIQKQLDG
ncbi:MAG: alpha/beta hydrolase [Gammaproteobacteria bacterium]|nr:alpha/beta hydrolase [Gammaproteobacteria bacterium]